MCRASRNTGRNLRVEVDKEISDRVRNLRECSDKLAVLRELNCAETKLRLVCRILSERAVRPPTGAALHPPLPAAPPPLPAAPPPGR